MRALIALLAVSMLSGCASMFSDEAYPVQVTSAPSGANFEVKDQDGVVVHNGMTPATLKLSAGEGYFDGASYLFTFRKAGYADSQFLLNSGVDGWYWGNILFGGVLGMLIIDPATGAMFDLPKTASASLSPLPAEPSAATVSAASTAPTGASGDQQLQQLMQQNLPYEEYQARYRQIMAE